VSVPETPGSLSCYYDGITDMRGYSYDSCLILPTAVTSANLDACQLYPNPATDYFTIKLVQPLAASVQLSVMDMLGRLREIRVLPAGQASPRIDSRTWPAGLYTLIVAGKEEFAHLKILRQ